MQGLLSISRKRSAGGGITIAGARNGLSVDAQNYIVLGGDFGSGDGALLSDREIPLNGFAALFSNDNAQFSFFGDGVNMSLSGSTSDDNKRIEFTTENSANFNIRMGVNAVNDSDDPNLVYLLSGTGGEMRIGDISGGATVPFLSFYTKNEERMRIVDTGELLIGRTVSDNFVYKLQVGKGDADTRVLFKSNTNFSIGVSNGVANGAAFIGASQTLNPDIIFSTSVGAEIARFTNGGALQFPGTGAINWIGSFFFVQSGVPIGEWDSDGLRVDGFVSVADGGAAGYGFNGNTGADQGMYANGDNVVVTAPNGALQLVASGVMQFVNNGAESARFTAGNNFLIGTNTSFAAQILFQVGSGAGDTRSVFAPNNQLAVGVSRGGNVAWIGASADSSPDIIFSNSAATEVARMLSGGGFMVAGGISTNGGIAEWGLKTYTAAASVPTGYVEVTINGATYRLQAEAV